MSNVTLMSQHHVSNPPNHQPHPLNTSSEEACQIDIYVATPRLYLVQPSTSPIGHDFTCSKKCRCVKLYACGMRYSLWSVPSYMQSLACPPTVTG